LENETFQNNPVTSSLNFLISFTDFIEVESSLYTRFNEKVEVIKLLLLFACAVHGTNLGGASPL